MSTYVPIATYTLPSATSSYTFSSIPSTYTDLVLVINGQTSTTNDVGVQLNSDTGSNYSDTVMYGTGSSALSARLTSTTMMYLDHNGWTTSQSIGIYNFMNYANTTTYKTMVGRTNNAANRGTEALVGLWRSTSAINSIKVMTSAGNLDTGMTLTLYGIKAA